MAGSKQPSLPARPYLVILVVMLALLVNGLFWAVRFPAWHPNDEPQHYLYASDFDGVEPVNGEPGPDQVPRDLQAFTELVDFGPHRTIKRTIDPFERRPDDIARLQAESDDPSLLAVYVDDAPSPDMKIIGHPDFKKYHVPFYYVSLGQVLRLSHNGGVGIRGRLLLGRLFSVLLGLLAVWLAMLLARVFWPDHWVLPALVGLVTGMQIMVAFYTSVLNSEVMAYVLFTAFLALGARAIVYRPSWLVIGAMVLVGLLAGATKITMIVLFPMGLIALMLCQVPRWVRAMAGGVLAICVAIALIWLLVPLGGGESVQQHYGSDDAQPRSFPAEMFTPGRIWEHAQMLRWYWGIQIGAAGWTDAWMPYRLHYVWSLLTIVSIVMGLMMLRRLAPQRRKLMLWLLTAPLLMAMLMFAIDYRFASMIGGSFQVRAQYFIPGAAAQMLWMVWGLTCCLKGRARTVVAAGLAVSLMVFNIWVLMRVLSPRYYGSVGWWEQCEQISQFWPMPAWGVALLDLSAVVMAFVAALVLIVALRSDEDRFSESAATRLRL